MLTQPLYINRVGALAPTIQARQKHQATVRKDINRFIHERYGINNFIELVHSFMPPHIQEAINRGESVGVLARQLPGICAEDVAMLMLCKMCKLHPLALSFYRDTFVTTSHDKRFRVKIPWLTWSKKGNPIVTYDDVAKDGMANADKMRLDKIVTKEGTTLVEYHENLRHRTFNGSYPLHDVSKLQAEFLALCDKNNPIEVYRDVNGRDVLTPGVYTKEEARNLTVRPPSGWYYVLYLSMFMDGSLILLDTYENPDGGVPEAKALFEKTVAFIAAEIKWTPLVLQTAPLCLDMMYCNRMILETRSAIETLCDRARLWHTTTYDASRHFADAAITFRG